MFLEGHVHNQAAHFGVCGVRLELSICRSGRQQAEPWICGQQSLPALQPPGSGEPLDEIAGQVEDLAPCPALKLVLGIGRDILRQGRHDLIGKDDFIPVSGKASLLMELPRL